MASTGITVDQPLESDDYVLEAPKNTEVIVNENGDPLTIIATPEEAAIPRVDSLNIIGEQQWFGLVVVFAITVILVMLVTKIITNRRV